MSAQPDHTPDVPADAEPVEIIGWLISQLVRQYNDEVAFRRDLQNVLGVEFLMPETPVLPTNTSIVHVNELARSLTEILGREVFALHERGNQLARGLSKVATAAATIPPTTVRRVERDENGRIARIIDEGVPPK